MECKRKLINKEDTSIFGSIRITTACIVIISSLITFSPSVEAANNKSYKYDSSGRLLSITVSNYQIVFSYDKNGNLLKRAIKPIK